VVAGGLVCEVASTIHFTRAAEIVALRPRPGAS
jgi:hypothetical protein